MKKLPEAIAAYREEFDEGPPIWGLEDDEAIEKIERALKSGEPIDDEGDVLPEDVFY